MCLQRFPLDNVLHFLVDRIDGVIPLFLGLAKNRSLKRVCLSWNQFAGTAFAEHASKFIARHKAIEEIDLKHNEISDQEFLVLAPALRKCKGMKSIYFDGNFLSDFSINTLLDAIKVRNNLKLLSFGKDRAISKASADRIGKIQAKFNTLEIVRGRVIMESPLPEVNFSDILLRRCAFLAMKPKIRKYQRNMDEFFAHELNEPVQFCSAADFTRKLQDFGARLDDELISQMAKNWTKVIANQKSVDLHAMAKHYVDRVGRK